MSIQRRLSAVDQLEATVQDNLRYAGVMRQSIQRTAFNRQLVAERKSSETKLMAYAEPGDIADLILTGQFEEGVELEAKRAAEAFRKTLGIRSARSPTHSAGFWYLVWMPSMMAGVSKASPIRTG